MIYTIQVTNYFFLTILKLWGKNIKKLVNKPTASGYITKQIQPSNRNVWSSHFLFWKLLDISDTENLLLKKTDNECRSRAIESGSWEEAQHSHFGDVQLYMVRYFTATQVFVLQNPAAKDRNTKQLFGFLFGWERKRSIAGCLRFICNAHINVNTYMHQGSV